MSRFGSHRRESVRSRRRESIGNVVGQQGNLLNKARVLQWLVYFISIACILRNCHEHSRLVFDGDCVQIQSGIDLDAPRTSSAHHAAKSSSSSSSSTTTTTTNGAAKDKIPKFVIDPIFRKEQDRIDHGTDDKTRCARYGVKSLRWRYKKHKRQPPPRRLFFGSMLANENPEVLFAHAIEVHNLYDVVALVESNTTHLGTPRTMRYGPDPIGARMLTESELFGTTNQTKVVVDYWLEDLPFLTEMDREVEQRNEIWKIWVKEGMQPHDVAIMADLDEVVSRDFLHALKVCDFPLLRHSPRKRAKCQAPKMTLDTIQFEASPLCVKRDGWFHPDVLLGQCIAGVGDPTGRVIPARSFPQHGERHEDWGAQDLERYPADVIEHDRFPLWDGRDIRTVHGSTTPTVNRVDADARGQGRNASYGTAYHLHNWFKDTEVLRDKFATFGHADEQARTRPLSEFYGDINMLVRCARGLGNNATKTGDGTTARTRDSDPPSDSEEKRGSEDDDDSEDDFDYFENNQLLPETQGTNRDGAIFSLGGNRPIYFLNRTYVEERHALVQAIVRADEAKYGTLYKDAAAADK